MTNEVTTQAVNIPVTTPLYEVGQSIKHLKSGGVYVITLGPNKGVLESTREPAYSYQMSDGRICHRAQHEVEDPARFRLYVLPNVAVSQ